MSFPGRSYKVAFAWLEGQRSNDGLTFLGICFPLIVFFYQVQLNAHIHRCNRAVCFLHAEPFQDRANESLLAESDACTVFVTIAVEYLDAEELLCGIQVDDFSR